AFETRNGQMHHHANSEAEKFAKEHNKIGIAGSDSHTLAGVALTYTEVPGARTVEEFFSGLRARRGQIHGDHGSLGKITGDVFRVTGAMLCEKPWALSLTPLAVLLPAITVGHWLNEIRFSQKWSKLINDGAKAPRRLWDLDTKFREA